MPEDKDTPAGSAKVGAEARSQSKGKDSDKFTPEQWAKKLGHVAKGSGLVINGKARPARYDIAHAAAAQLHGWELHKMQTTEPLLLTQVQYAEALIAAEKPSARDSKGRAHYAPCPTALSPFARKRG
jgi:hypothetical protein